jgi:hypothetical protein
LPTLQSSRKERESVKDPTSQTQRQHREEQASDILQHELHHLPQVSLASQACSGPGRSPVHHPRHPGILEWKGWLFLGHRLWVSRAGSWHMQGPPPHPTPEGYQPPSHTGQSGARPGLATTEDLLAPVGTAPRPASPVLASLTPSLGLGLGPAGQGGGRQRETAKLWRVLACALN